jgi:uncharacterized repeat protein (TIGR01451 family)
MPQSVQSAVSVAAALEGRRMNSLRLFVLFITFTICLPAAQLPVTLNSAANFTVLGYSTVTNTGPTIVNGNIGLSPGTALTGFPPGTIVGGAAHLADSVAGTAQIDLTTAYNDAAGRTAPTIIAVPDIGGQTLPPGLYKTGATPSVGITGTLTLDGGGNANAVFIFQIASTLTTANVSQVALINGANPANVFWQVGSSATLGTTSIFAGTILAQVSITIQTGASLNGRALARTGAVTLDSNTAVNPGPPITTTASPTLTSVNCPLPTAIVGAAYNSRLIPTGGTAPYNFFINGGALPAGLALNASTGAITGSPTGAGGTSLFSTNATDSEGPPVTATNSCSIVVTAASGSADVSIVKTGPPNVVALATITYNLAVANAGPIAAAGVTVTDILPPGTTFVSATPTQGSCSFTSAVTCSLGAMANGGSATIVLVVTAPNSSGPLANTATVVSTTPDPNTANNSSTWIVTLGAASVPALSMWGLGVLALLLAACSMRFVSKTHLPS